MILGIGTDITEIARISKSIENKRFTIKVFSKAEIEYCETKTNKAENYAARFAAKEAFLKALGTGLRAGITINEIEIVNDNLGKPSIHLIGKTAEIILDKNIQTIHVSLSHVKDMAMATVILEG
jgi:holo-[acyl-carrier protein] synthase